MSAAEQGAAAGERAVDVGGDPFHHLLFEDQSVRIFRVEIPAGGETRLHHHPHGFATIALAPGQVRDQRPGGEPAVKEWTSGQTNFAPGGFAHRVRNLGSEPFRAVIVEVKR